MSETTTRKKERGLAGNGGEFTFKVNTIDGITLVSLASDTEGPTAEHVALAAHRATTNPGTNGAHPNYWWRLDRARALTAPEEPLDLTDAEHTGWASVDRNVVPLVKEWLNSQPLSWVSYQVGRQEDASRMQASTAVGLTDKVAWAARADRLATLAKDLGVLAAEEDAERDAERDSARRTPFATPPVSATAAALGTAGKDRAVTPVAEKPPVFAEVNRMRRGQKFFTAEMTRWPKIGTHQDTPLAEIPIVGHFFAGPFDFYAAEYDPQTGEAWGFTRINGLGEGEWGYTSMCDLEEQLIGPFKQPIERESGWLEKAFGTLDRF